MKGYLPFVLSLFASVAGAATQGPIHDCRIASVDIRAFQKGNGLFVHAVFLTADGAALNPDLCPDQVGPTWTASHPIGLYTDYGYGIIVRQLPPHGVVTILLETSQARRGQGPVYFSKVKRIRTH